MMRNAWIVAAKEFRHMLHDRLALVLTIALPVFQLLLYGYALDWRIRNVPAMVLNRDTHHAGRLLAARIAQSPLFLVQPSNGSDADVERALRAGTIRAAIEIPETYTADLLYRRKPVLRVWVDGSNVVVSNYVLSALETLAYQEAKDAAAPQIQALGIAPEIGMRPQVMFNPEGRTTVYLIPGLIAILIQTVTTLLLALSITAERESGTLELLKIARVSTNSIVTGKCLAVACIGLLECVFLILLMRWVFDIGIQGSAALLLGITPLLVLAPLGIGLIIAGNARKQAHVLQLTHLVVLPSIMLSGFILPREFLNFPISWIGNLLPTTYLVDLTRAVILRGASLAEIAPAIAAALALGVVLLACGYWAMNRSTDGS